MMMSNKTSSANVMNPFIANHYAVLTNADKNEKGTIILWFGSIINSYENIEQMKTRLEDVNADVVMYSELEQCVHFVRAINEQKIVLVISGHRTTLFLPSFVIFNQIKAIFIICSDTVKCEHLTSAHSKIIGIYTNLSSLCAAIREEIHDIDKQLLTFTCFDPPQTSVHYMSKETAKFFWFQLFTCATLRLSSNEQTKKQMISMCQQYYHDKRRQQNLINQFEREYQPEQALRWYLKKSFIGKLINKALRKQDINQLYIFRFLIEDLTKNLANEHQKILDSNEHKLIAYRGIKLTKKALKKLRTNEGALISMNGYFSASRHRSLAVASAMESRKGKGLVPVLFEIECNILELGKTILFANIAQYSDYADKEEILFNINATFRLNSIQHHTHLWLVKISATDDGRKIVEDYLKKKYHESEEKTINIVFGRLICCLGQYDQAQMYFEQLLNEPNGDDLAWLQFNLGRTLDLKGQWNIAQGHYDRVYERMINVEPPRWKEVAYILNKLGMISYDQGHYDRALHYYQRALAIQQTFDLSDDIDNAQILGNIALILNIRGNYDEALNHYHRALNISKKVYSIDHSDVARNLNNIGNILYATGKYDEAAGFYQQALRIQQNLYPEGLLDTAHILNSIALIVNIQGKYNDALDFCQHALEIQQNLYPPDHIDLAGSLNNIGFILYNRGKYDQALYYYQRALKIRRRYYSFGHRDLARSLNNIGNVLYQQSQYDQALDYYFQALSIQEEFYSSDHIDIALCLNNIGCALDRQEKADEAIYYHQHALRIQQKLYTYDHPDIAFTLNNLGNILCQQQKYQEALDYHQRALNIREQCYPCGHVDIGDSLNNIGIIYQHARKSKMSLTYLQRALVIYENVLPSEHFKIETVRENINHISAKK